MRTFITLFPLLVAAVIMAGCESAPLETDPDAYRLKGTLSGRVELDDYRDPPEPLSTIAVSIAGTNYATTTDSNGRWSIQDLPAGIYTVDITKAGFAPVRRYNQQFVGGGNLYMGGARLTRIPSEYGIASFQLDSLKPAGTTPYIVFSGTVMADSLPPGMMVNVIVTKDSAFDANTLLNIDPNSDPVDSYYMAQLSINNENKRFESGSYFNVKNLYDRGFNKGEQIYAAAYLVYHTTGLNSSKSTVVSLILP